MIKIINKVTLFFLFLLLMGTGKTQAQTFFDGVNIGFKLGVSKLITEIEPGFTGTMTEFNNGYGLAPDLEISKNIGRHWNTGVEIFWSPLSGTTKHPNFTATDWHYEMKNLEDKPIEYKTKLVGPKFFANYYFRDQENTTLRSINPFIRAGVGFGKYKSRLNYIGNTENIIFGKEVGKYKDWTVSSAIFSLGGGIKSKLSSHLFLSASANFNIANYDFLDVVHNYTATGERQNMLGLFSEFKIGIFYEVGSAVRFISGIGKGKATQKSNAVNNRPNLPFSGRK